METTEESGWSESVIRVEGLYFVNLETCLLATYALDYFANSANFLTCLLAFLRLGIDGEVYTS